MISLKTVPQVIPKNHVTEENCKIGMRVERGRDFGKKWNSGDGSSVWIGQGEFEDSK